MAAARLRTHISQRAAQNLTSNKLGEIRAHCFYNQYEPATNPNGIIALAVAENKLMRDEITEHINQNFKINPWHLTYGQGPQGALELRTQLAKYVNKVFKPVDPVDEKHICVCNGAGTAVSMLGFCVGEPGEGMLVGRPLYVGFFPDIEASSKIKPVLVPMGSTDPTSEEAVEHYEKAFQTAENQGIKIRALLLSSPHNPLGRPYTTQALVAYMRLCQKYNIHLISDEVYARSFFPSIHFPAEKLPTFQSVLAIPNLSTHIDPSLVHVIYGMSKDFCANGIRIGCLISPYNTTLLKAFKSIASFSRASQLAEHAWLNLLSDQNEPWLDQTYFPELTRRMTAAYELVAHVFDRNQIPYTKACVTSFIWFDLRKYLDQPTEEAELALNWRMVREAKVWIAMGASFGAEESGFFRITFASPREELETGLAKLIDLLQRIEKEKRRNGTWKDG